MLEVVALPDVDADEGHELQLRQPLARGRRQRQEVPQLPDLCVDHVPPHLRGALGGLGAVEAEGKEKRGETTGRVRGT